MMLRNEAIDSENTTNGGVFNPQNNAVYSFSYQNPIRYIDPDGECPNCITAIGGAIGGGLIGGLLEGGMQLYRDGKITNWKAIRGSVLQGAITGGVAGFTGGASLAVTAGVSAGANVVGGIANRAIQGQSTTATDVAVGGVVGGAGKYLNIFKSNSIIRNRTAFLDSELQTSKNGMSSVGRALQKHVGREGSSFSNISFSGKTATDDGMNVLKDIINSPKQLIDHMKNGTKTIYDKSTGRGVNISRDGKFNGFRDIIERNTDDVIKQIKQ